MERFVVPDCREPDSYHDPAGTRPAVYAYVHRDEKWNPGLDFVWVLCVECCARIRLASQRPGAGTRTPAPVRIHVLRDANTLEPVI